MCQRLKQMNLPDVFLFENGGRVNSAGQWKSRRQEILDIFSRQIYGITPAAPDHVEAETERECKAFGGKALQRDIRLSFDTPQGRFSFPYVLLTPLGVEKAPAFVSLHFRKEIPQPYFPAEEIIDRGFAAAALYYQDVTADSGEWDGIAPMYPLDEETGWGKLGMWAFAASRVMDDLMTRPEIDGQRVAIVGHSRLGKAALWCGAQDERFSLVVSNASGCAGAALARENTGERVKNITDMFPYWFCGNYHKWAGRENEMPFDQHMLLALAAPRKLYVASGSEDAWACPANEWLSCVAASPVWKLLGKQGMEDTADMPAPHQPMHDGDIGHHIRRGSHFFSRTDWGYLMDFRDKQSI